MYFFFHVATAPSGPVPPQNRGFTITFRHTPHTVGLPWTSDQPDAQNSTLHKQHSKETDIHGPGGVRTRNSSKRAAADPRLIPRGHRDWRCNMIYNDTVYLSWRSSPTGREICVCSTVICFRLLVVNP